jgi:hypothetical protein
MFIIFPNFQMKAILGTDDVYLDAAPVQSTIHHHLDLANINSSIDSNITTNEFCTKRADNLLKTLRQYYKEIKTKRQLSLDVPAGFCKSSNLQQNSRTLTPPRKSSKTADLSLLHSSTESRSNISINDDDYPKILSSSNYADNAHPNPSSPTESIHIPIVRSVDKPSSSLPENILLSEDLLHASVGFHRVDTLKRCFQNLYKTVLELILYLPMQFSIPVI